MIDDLSTCATASAPDGRRHGRHVVVRTHGGLGNQIFQIFYARLIAAGREPRLIHDANYPHGFGLSAAFADGLRPGAVARAISATRIPKLLERSRLSARGSFTLGATTFLDGYFQDVHFYAPFDPAAMCKELERLRRELKIEPGEVHGAELHHIRLGDFFLSERAQRDYLAARITDIPAGGFIVTNREDLVGEVLSRPGCAAKSIAIVPSGTSSADDALRLMSRYETIISNDSTLAFWAACLAGRRLRTPSPLLNALFARFADPLRPQAAVER